MHHHIFRGATLIELIVALLLLEFAGLIAVTAALQVGRTRIRLAEGAAFDLARLDTLATIEADSVCRTTTAPTAVQVILPAGNGRPAFDARVRCGR